MPSHKKPIDFKLHYLSLGSEFYSKTNPVKPSKPYLIQLNHDLINELDLDETDINSENAVNYFSGNQIPIGTEAIALAYSGHQYGRFNPQLGDGRAVLLGQINDLQGKLRDIHLKGSGQTVFSRNGDGLSALGPVIREYLLCEAMHKLGVPTTRALAAVTTGDQVYRETIIPGGIITRVAHGFIRVGTFQYFSSKGQLTQLKQLADYVLQHYYPELLTEQYPYQSLLAGIINKQARLIAKWMNLGFVHGVMNTDNMSITGETIDYGPCAFMDNYIADQVFSSIDRNKRYAFCYQPSIALWNLTRLAECFMPLFLQEAGSDDAGSDDESSESRDNAVEIAENILQKFEPLFQQYWLNGMREKMGIAIPDDTQLDISDRDLVQGLLDLMQDNGADFTLSFYYLSKADKSEEDKRVFTAIFHHSQAINNWLEKLAHRRQQDKDNKLKIKNTMDAVNPIYIPRNHQVEKAIRAAEDNLDFSKFEQLLQVLQQPFTYQQGMDEYLQAPKPHEVVKQTFCGT